MTKNCNNHRRNNNFAALSTTTLRMSDFDFPSAMPMKPELTMKEKLQESVSLIRWEVYRSSTCVISTSAIYAAAVVIAAAAAG